MPLPDGTTGAGGGGGGAGAVVDGGIVDVVVTGVEVDGALLTVVGAKAPCAGTEARGAMAFDGREELA